MHASPVSQRSVIVLQFSCQSNGCKFLFFLKKSQNAENITRIQGISLCLTKIYLKAQSLQHIQTKLALIFDVLSLFVLPPYKICVRFE